MKRIIIAVLCVIGMAGAAFASDVCPRQSGEEVRAIAKTSPTAKISEMGQEETRSFLKAWNAYPPPSNYVGDHAFVIDDPRSPKLAVILLDKNDCVTWIPLPTRPMFLMMMTSI